jgi:hypothetical protein
MRDAETEGERAMAYGTDREAALCFRIMERADALASVLEEYADMKEPVL